MTYRHLLLALCISIGASPLFAQEVISPLTWNPALYYEQEALSKVSKPAFKKSEVLELPFFDDFSSTRTYPDKARWIDRDVYINTSFCVRPPSHGVATFDGLDQRGFPYNTDGFNNPRPCDSLTSCPIDIKDLTEADSLYLSFYLQQKGLGDNPETNDSFILEFRTENNFWVKAWTATVKPKSNKIYPFEQFLVPIKHDNFNLFHDSFQFRFRTYGNKTGALDHWHLDYVYLDKDRTQTDTIVRDVSIARPPKGLFKTYYSMPYRHFAKNRNAYLNPKIDYHVINKDSLTQNPDIYYDIRDVTNDELLYSSFDEKNQLVGVAPFSTKTGSQDNKLPNDYFRSKGDPKVKLELKMNVSSTNLVSDFELTEENDEFVMYQNFDDYFAYDDGSAEGGYGLQNVREGAVALEFRVEVPDTLKYVAFHFTGGFEALPDQQKFSVMVWEKIEPVGQEVVISKLSGVRPQYSDYINGYVLYELEKPVVISGNFYVGWQQFSTFNMNVGIDLDYRFFNDSMPNPNLWFNSSGQWQQSKVVGTPMIRPVFQDGVVLSTQEPKASKIAVYPNPIQDFVTIQAAEDGMVAQVFNLQGQLIEQKETSSNKVVFQTQHLQKGVYLVRVKTENGSSFSQKLVKQ